MGIPLLFGYLARKYKKVKLIRKYNEYDTCDNLFIDYNGLIHKVINDYTEEDEITDERMFMDVYRYTVDLYKMVKPRKMMYIAIDGVAPRAKMNQQRMRRFKSSLRSSEGNFDRNRVTPGTEFMEELSLYLHQKFKEIKGVKVIFSDVNERGEGEHKIIKYVRENQEELKDDMNFLQGLDADLIMLTMSINPRFKLLREDQRNESEYLIFDVGIMKGLLIDDIQDGINVRLERQRVVYDFIVISFMLGNDFLMNLPTIKIKSNGVMILLNVYKKMFRFRILNSNKYLVNEDKTVNMRLLAKYLELVGGSEEYYYKNQNIDFEEYKKNYYLENFKTSSEEYIKSVGEKYIEGIQWVCEYYLKGVKDWKWYYPYYYSMFASDIKYCQKKTFKYNDSYKPIEQLVSVLPEKSLPRKYREKMNEEVRYMFPDKFEIDNRDENIPEHARNALIPFVDDEVLFKVMFKN